MLIDSPNGCWSVDAGGAKVVLGVPVVLDAGVLVVVEAAASCRAALSSS